MAVTKPHVDELKAAAQTIGNASVIQATADIAEAVQINGALLQTMAAFKTPADKKFCTTESAIVQLMQRTENSSKTDRKSPMDVMKVCTDGFQLFFWHTTPGNDLLGDYMTEIESQVLFYGNRIRKKGKDEEKAWFEAYNGMMQALKTFLITKKETICDWTGRQDSSGAAAFFTSQCSGQS